MFFGKIFINFALKLFGVVLGSIIYYVVYQLVIGLGMSSDDMKLITALTVAVFLTIPHFKAKHHHRKMKKAEREEYREKLKILGLLSSGQRQALTLLMASLQKPKLLLLDEHTAALDPKTAAKVLDTTNEIVTRDNLTTVMITHNMKDAIRLGTRLVMMDCGHIIYDVSGEEKQRLEVKDLLQKFEEAALSGPSDRMLLGNA